MRACVRMRVRAVLTTSRRDVAAVASWPCASSSKARRRERPTFKRGNTALQAEALRSESQYMHACAPCALLGLVGMEHLCQHKRTVSLCVVLGCRCGQLGGHCLAVAGLSEVVRSGRIEVPRRASCCQCSTGRIGVRVACVSNFSALAG